MSSVSTQTPLNMHFCLHPVESNPHDDNKYWLQTRTQEPEAEQTPFPHVVLGGATVPAASSQHAAFARAAELTRANVGVDGSLNTKSCDEHCVADDSLQLTQREHDAEPRTRHSHSSSGSNTPLPHCWEAGAVTMRSPHKPDVRARCTPAQTSPRLRG